MMRPSTSAYTSGDYTFKPIQQVCRLICLPSKVCRVREAANKNGNANFAASFLSLGNILNLPRLSFDPSGLDQDVKDVNLV